VHTHLESITGFNVLNCGLSGSTASRYTNKPYLRSDAQKQAKNWIPEITVILLGTNDINNANYEHIEDYENGLVAIAETVGGKIFFCVPPPYQNREKTDVIKEVLFPMINSAAARVDGEVINLLEKDWSNAYYDNIHLNANGMEKLANYIANSISKHVSQPSSSTPPNNFNGHYHSDINQICLLWDEVDSADQYTLYRGVNEYWAPVYLEISGDQQSTIDTLVENGNTYFYAISSLVSGEISERSSLVTIETATLNTEEIEEGDNLEVFKILGNFPNPFNSATTIQYKLNQSSRVDIVIYNIMGKEIIQLFQGNKEPGLHQIRWKGIDKYGHPVGAGTYIYQIQTDNIIQREKMIFLK
jgi:hypothetical protein